MNKATIIAGITITAVLVGIILMWRDLSQVKSRTKDLIEQHNNMRGLLNTMQPKEPSSNSSMDQVHQLLASYPEEEEEEDDAPAEEPFEPAPPTKKKKKVTIQTPPVAGPLAGASKGGD